MPNLNKVMLMGNLTRDPELRHLPSNMPVVGFGMAINRRWKSKEGENKEETTFVDCNAFARTAEVINQYFKKGQPIYVEGRLRLERWQDKKDGSNRTRMSVTVESFEFLESRGGGDNSSSYAPAGHAAPQGRAPADGPPSGGGGGGAGGGAPHQAVNDGDIPF